MRVFWSPRRDRGCRHEGSRLCPGDLRLGRQTLLDRGSRQGFDETCLKRAMRVNSMFSVIGQNECYVHRSEFKQIGTVLLILSVLSLES